MAEVTDKPAARTGADWDAQIDAQSLVLVTDGEYIARYIEHETVFLFNSGKAILKFEIIDGVSTGVRLIRPYRVKKLLGRPSRGGRFVLGRSSELLRDIVRLSGYSQRPDRASLTLFKNRLWRVRTRTVDKDYKQRLIPEALRYSVIDEIIEAETE